MEETAKRVFWTDPSSTFRPVYRLATTIFALVAVTAILSASAGAVDRPSFPAMFMEKEVFLQAIAREQKVAPPHLDVTGISVPHHLLAADLIARGFWAATGNHYDRVILISPDHFNRSGRLFATTRLDFETVFGLIKNDRAASSSLLEASELFEESDLFEKEHGIAALLPFVKHFFGDAKIVPIAISGTSTRADWDRALNVVRHLMGPRVLVVQSTDYSHYLPQSAAIQRDQETLNIIAANDAEAVERLEQVLHMDSKAAQYMQMRLQSGVSKSHGVVIGSRNSEAYGSSPAKTTSYIVTVYIQASGAGSQLSYSDQKVIYFGGDTLIGRLFNTPLSNPAVAEAIVAEVNRLTGGAPLVVNLESVLLQDPPEKLPSDILVSHANLAVPILKALNVRAASLANNHSFDLGSVGYAETQSILRRAGIEPLLFKEIVDLGSIRIVALNFIANRHDDNMVATDSDLKDVCRMVARPPLIAFVHWGQEFAFAASPVEYAASDALQSCGVSAVIGAHSHRASPRIEARQGGEHQMTFSLGNLLFDQRGGRSSTSLLELRVFDQGTFAARLVPAPNLYEFGSALFHKLETQKSNR